MPPELTPDTLPDGAYIGHLHLKVADLDRAVAWYCDRPRANSPRDADGTLVMRTDPLDLDDLPRCNPLPRESVEGEDR